MGGLKVFHTVGTLKALAPIHHGGDEKTGSTPLLRTITVYNPDTTRYYEIPYISGNTVQGRLRRLLMADWLALLGVDLTNAKLYHTLFAGGTLEESEEESGYIDLELRRKIYHLLPPVALFGGTFGNQIISSRLIVGHMFPKCAELEGILYPKNAGLPPVRSLTAFSFITRRDELQLPRDENEQAVQMKVDYLCFVPGTEFSHQFHICPTTPLLESALGRAIELWKEVPFIGGRSAGGEGALEISYDPLPDSGLYLEFVTQNANAACELLATLEKVI